MNDSVYVILLAGGIGERLTAQLPKQFIKIAGKTTLEHTIEIFEKHEKVNGVVLVINPNYRNLTEQIIIKNKYKKIVSLVNGGKTRQESSWAGLSSLQSVMPRHVLIHDSVRPLLSTDIIDEVIDALDKGEVAVDVAISAADTIIKVREDDENYIEHIPDRKYLKRGQTPQGFEYVTLVNAHKEAIMNNIANCTDDCGLILKFNGGKVFVVKGSEDNIKLTYPVDLYIADKLFQLKRYTLSIEGKSIIKHKIKGHVYVVFGAKGGIGSCICDLLRALGADVVPFGKEIDVTDANLVKKALEQVMLLKHKINGVINTVGVLGLCPIISSSIDKIRQSVEVNLIGAINVAKESEAYLIETKGHLLFFGSSSYTRGRAGYIPYSAAKAGLVNLVQGLAEEVIEDSIKVNIVIPDRTKTSMRTNNFGVEPEELLLDPKTVAIATVNVLASSITGAIVDVKKINEKEIVEKFSRIERL